MVMSMHVRAPLQPTQPAPPATGVAGSLQSAGCRGVPPSDALAAHVPLCGP